MVDSRYRRKLDLVTSQVVAGYEGGASLRDLASMYQCCANTIRRVLISEGVKLRTRGRKRELKTLER